MSVAAGGDSIVPGQAAAVGEGVSTLLSEAIIRLVTVAAVRGVSTPLFEAKHSGSDGAGSYSASSQYTRVERSGSGEIILGGRAQCNEGESSGVEVEAALASIRARSQLPAYRGRMYHEGMKSGSASSVSELRVKDNLKDEMFFV